MILIDILYRGEEVEIKNIDIKLLLLFFHQVRVILAALIVKIKESNCQLKLRDLSMAIIGNCYNIALHKIK